VEVLGEEEEKVGVTHWVWLPAVASLAAVLVFTPVGDRALSWFSGLQLVEKLTTAVVDPAPENSVNQIPDAEVKAATPLIAKTDSNQSESTKISDVAAGDLLATAMIDTPSISELLREYAALNGKAEAFSRLTTLWGERLDLFDDDRVCREIERLSLRCFKSRGTWNNLRSHNRAAILVLKPLTDVSHYVVVTQVENGRVSLDFAGEKVEYPISHVDPYWFGDYWLLWRPPPLRSLQLSLDDAGADVLWLRQALNRVASSRGSLSDLNEERPVFDTELLQHVIGFQRRNALNADGVVGVETLMRLNAMLKGDELPLLIRSPTS
jgi:general secretion pathway protein A